MSNNPFEISNRHFAFAFSGDPEAELSINSINELIAMAFPRLFPGEDINKLSIVNMVESFTPIFGSHLFVVVEEITPGHGRLYVSTPDKIVNDRLEDRYHSAIEIVAFRPIDTSENGEEVLTDKVEIVVKEKFTQDVSDTTALYPFVPMSLTVEDESSFDGFWEKIEHGLLHSFFPTVKTLLGFEGLPDAEVPFPATHHVRNAIEEVYNNFIAWEPKPMFPVSIRYEAVLVPVEMTQPPLGFDKQTHAFVKYDWCHRVVIEAHGRAQVPLGTLHF